ncbi:MAG: phosphohydrolase, partial [Prevotella sp.]|nr:phosphohydrolase [Prevotella sp.]
ILSMLAKNMLNRRLFTVEVREEEPTADEINEIKATLAEKTGIPIDDAHYLMSVDCIQKDMYDITDDHIDVLYKDGTIKDIAEASEILNVELLSKKICKYYLSYQRI